MRDSTGKRDEGFSVTTAAAHATASEDRLPEEVGARVRDWLRGRWPRHTVKHVQRELMRPRATVKGWVEQGRVPQNRELLRMMRHFGPEFAGFVLEPVLGEQATALLTLDVRVAAVRARLDALQADLAQAQAILDRRGGSDDVST